MFVVRAKTGDIDHGFVGQFDTDYEADQAVHEYQKYDMQHPEYYGTEYTITEE